MAEFTNDTLGSSVAPGLIRIMVTMSSEAADDPAVIESLLQQGMTIMRVNCAHDGPEDWGPMVSHLDAAKAKTGRECRVAFDLAGPKLRTGPLLPGPEVIRFTPARDKLGHTVAAAPIPFGPAGINDVEGITSVPVEPSFDGAIRTGDEIHVTDTRGRSPVLQVVEVKGQSFYACAGGPLTWRRD